MNWIIVAIFSYIFWGLVNVGDKYLISSKVKNPYVYMVLLTWFGVIGLSLIPFVDFFLPDINYLLLIFLATLLYFLGSIFYYQAIKVEDISRVNILWNLIPVFTLIIAWLTIGEELNFNQFLAFIVLFIGAVLASLHFSKSKFSFSKVLLLMVLATVFYGAYAVMIRYISHSIPFINIYIWNLMTVILLTFTLFLAPKFRRSFKNDVKLLDKKVFFSILVLAVLDEMGVLFNMWALSLGPAALIFALEGFQSLFVFSLTVILSLNHPHILKEELDRKNVILKIAALIVIICGVVLVNLA